MLQIKALGPLRIWVNGTIVDDSAWHRHSTKQVLQLLLAKKNYRVSKSETIDLLWPELNADSAINKLYISVNGIRNILEPERVVRGKSRYLTTNAGHIELLLKDNDVEFDVAYFENLIAQSENHTNKFEILERAIEAYTGELFSGSASEACWLQKRKELQQKYSFAVIQLSRHRFERKEFDSAERLLLNLQSIEPTHEESCRWLMRVCTAKGARSQAIEHYEILRKSLIESLGIKPDVNTEHLLQDIRKGVNFMPGASPSVPLHMAVEHFNEAVESAPGPVFAEVSAPSRETLIRQYRISSNLLRPIIGRDEIYAMLKQLLQQRTAKNICLHGLHGIGKSALAVHVAYQIQEHFSHGAIRVDFSDVSEPNGIATKLQQALDIPQHRFFMDFLADAKLLVLADQIKSAGLAEAVLKFFEPYDNIVVLITARNAIHTKEVYCQNVFVAPLPTVVEAAEATSANLAPPSISLFIEKLKSSNPGLKLLPGSELMQAIASMVVELDGIPGAIEMAANLTLHMPIDEVKKQIDTSASGADVVSFPVDKNMTEDKFAQLTEINCETLSEVATSGLMALSVFRDKFSFAAAKHLFNTKEELLITLSELVDTGLLTKDANDQKTPYRLTRLSKRFAHKKLCTDQTAYNTINRRLALFLLETCEKYAQDFDAGIAPSISSAFQALYDDILAAIDWCIENDLEIGTKLCILLKDFWLDQNTLSHALERYKKMLNAVVGSPGADRVALQQLHAALAKLYSRINALDRSVRHLNDALSVSSHGSDTELEFELHSELIGAYLDSGHYEKAHLHIPPLIQKIVKKNDKVAATAWLNIAEYHGLNAAFEEANVCVESGLDIARWHAPIHVFIQALLKKSAFLLLSNNYAEAQYALKECQQLALAHNYLHLRANISLQQAEAFLGLGSIQEAENCFLLAKDHSLAYINKKYLSLSVMGLCKCAVLQKKYDSALLLLDDVKNLLDHGTSNTVSLEAERLGLLLNTLCERHTEAEQCLKEIKRSWKFVTPVSRQHFIDSILVVGAAHGLSPIVSMLGGLAKRECNYFIRSKAERDLLNLVYSPAGEKISNREQGSASLAGVPQWDKSFSMLQDHLHSQTLTKLYG